MDVFYLKEVACERMDALEQGLCRVLGTAPLGMQRCGSCFTSTLQLFVDGWVGERAAMPKIVSLASNDTTADLIGQCLWRGLERYWLQ